MLARPYRPSPCRRLSVVSVLAIAVAMGGCGGSEPTDGTSKSSQGSRSSESARAGERPGGSAANREGSVIRRISLGEDRVDVTLDPKELEDKVRASGTELPSGVTPEMLERDMEKRALAGFKALNLPDLSATTPEQSQEVMASAAARTFHHHDIRIPLTDIFIPVACSDKIAGHHTQAGKETARGGKLFPECPNHPEDDEDDGNDDNDSPPPDETPTDEGEGEGDTDNPQESNAPSSPDPSGDPTAPSSPDPSDYPPTEPRP